MADADKELKIQIVTTADTVSVEDYNSELRKLGAGIEDNTEKMARNAAEATHSSGTHWELRRGFEQLSQIIPGLGPVVGLLGEGFRDMGEGAEAGAAGIDSLVATLGPVAVVILAIQAAVEYWDLFVKKSEDASAAVSKAYKEIETESAKALAAFNALQDSIAGEKRPEKTYEEQLQQQKTLLEARQKVAEEVAKAQEQAELSAAGKNEAQKAEIQQRYEREGAARKLTFAQQEIDLQNGVLKKAQDNVNMSQLHLEVLKELLAGIPAADLPLRQQYLTRIASESDSTLKVQDFINRLQGEIGTASQVNAINAGGNSAVNAIGDKSSFETGVRAALGDFGPKLDGKQQAALQEVQAIFQATHANMDVWLGYLRQFKLTNDQKMRDIDNELNVLSHQVAVFPTQTTR